MAAEPAKMRPLVIMIPPPCERRFQVFYREGEPFALELDGKYFTVKPRRRSPRINGIDQIVVVVEKRPHG